MSNLADEIEKFILEKFSDEHIVLIKRNELAYDLACAPSQITYVLSTRFTLDRGFIVESRRGLGGFVRIARIPIEEIFVGEAAENTKEVYSNDEIALLITKFAQQELITRRESALLLEFLEIASNYIEPKQRVALVRHLLAVLFQV